MIRRPPRSTPSARCSVIRMSRPHKYMQRWSMRKKNKQRMQSRLLVYKDGTNFPTFLRATSFLHKWKNVIQVLVPVPRICLVFLTQPVRKAIKNGYWKTSSTRLKSVIYSLLLHFFLYNRYWLSGFSIFVVQLWNKIRDFPHNLTGNTFKELSAKVRKYPTPDAVMMF